MSRTPVREAIARLVQDGLAMPARRSTRTQVAVAPLTEADLHELYTIMGALEGAAARHVGDMTPADRKTLAVTLAKANAAFERDRPAAVRRTSSGCSSPTTRFTRCSSNAARRGGCGR